MADDLEFRRAAEGAPVPAYRPRLPGAAAIARYLEALDASRIYANRGELTWALEARLGQLLDLQPEQLLLTASGTAALAAAILAVAGRAEPARPYCLCPGYTFVAVPLAAEQCGYRPYLVDVDPATWALDPERLAVHPLLQDAGVVLAAAPYGRAFPAATWAEFTRATSVPVVIDAAAGIERFADGGERLAGAAPVVLSLHATKPFATGEGGAVICERPATLLSAAAALNFGFAGARETVTSGFNGKLSEYHAAVGLAELDGWTAKRMALRVVANQYAEAAATRGLRVHTAPTVGSTYALFEACDEDQALRARSALSAARLDSRLWYGRGVHREPYFAGVERDPLPGVDAIAPRLIGLPVAEDLAPETIGRIVDILAAL